MASTILKALAIFGVFLFAKSTVDQMYPVFRFLGYLLGIGWPLAIIGDPIGEFIYNYIKTRIIENSTRRAFSESIKKMAESAERQNSFKERETVTSQGTYQGNSSLLTSAQIEQLNLLRASVDVTEVTSFPKISIAGRELPNLVPSAGMFTAKIKRKNPNGNILNLVVMLATPSAVSDFESRLEFTDRRDFWAQGYLLPSRTGICYAVLYVTSFRLCGRSLNF